MGLKSSLFAQKCRLFLVTSVKNFLVEYCDFPEGLYAYDAFVIIKRVVVKIALFSLLNGLLLRTALLAVFTPPNVTGFLAQALEMGLLVWCVRSAYYHFRKGWKESEGETVWVRTE